MGKDERDTKRIGIIGEPHRCVRCKEPMDWSRAKLCYRCMRRMIEGRFNQLVEK